MTHGRDDADRASARSGPRVVATKPRDGSDPRVVVITNRQLVGGAELLRRIATIVSAVPRGSVLIQIREKDLDGGPLFELARDVLEVARPAGAPVWLNDRVDVALAAGVDGVHLPERGMGIVDARLVAARLGRTLAVGCSRHTMIDAVFAAASGADLVQLGPIWPTPGKCDPLGVAALGLQSELPPHAKLVAVGGIDNAFRARVAAAAGADAVAVIRAAWQADDPGAALAALVEAVAAGIAVRQADVAHAQRQGT